MHTLECGCQYDENGQWLPCPDHVKSTLDKVRQAHAEVAPMERCDNCGDMKVKGIACFRCGVGPKVGRG